MNDSSPALSLARVSRRLSGRAIIEDLARKDLMPDAFAWRTLAIARRLAGDAAGANLADDRCRATAKVTTICKPGRTI